MLTINGKPLKAEYFAYDGCHKIYLCNTPDEVTEMSDLEYTIYHVSRLPRVWEGTCWLRFISPASLDRPDYVEQGAEDVEIVYTADALKE